MTITTKKGDNGKSYWKNVVVEKDDTVLELIGGLDELQAVLGLVKVIVLDKKIIERVELVQKDLMNIACNLADYGCGIENRIKTIEDEIVEIENSLPKLTKFIIPGVNNEESYLNLARTVCRRIERVAVKLSKEKELDSNILIYLNRLSDYLFLLMRKTIN